MDVEAGAADENRQPAGERLDHESLAAAAEVVGGRWTLLVVDRLTDGPKAFSELARSIPGISHVALSDRLRQLVDAGIVTRRSTGPRPAPVYYALSEYGTTLLPLVDGLRAWGREHLRLHR